MDLYQNILTDFNLQDSNILNVYPYGSRIYKTNTEKSDHDFIVVCESVITESDQLDSKDHPISITLYSQLGFQNQIDQHKIKALECLSLPPDQLLKSSYQPNFKLDKSKLRISISEKCSKDWGQSKKRFSDSKGWNPILNQPYIKKVYEAKKSLFHCFRMIDFGMQIIHHGKIIDFESCNHLWQEILNNPSEDWEDYKKKYQNSFNLKMTEFRKVAPKL